MISNKSLLSQGTGEYGTEENARMTSSFTGLAHQHLGHIAISHLEFGVRFKEMLVNEFPKGYVIHFHNDARGDCTIHRSYEETGTSSLFLLWHGKYGVYKVAALVLKLMNNCALLYVKKKVESTLFKTPRLCQVSFCANSCSAVLRRTCPGLLGGTASSERPFWGYSSWE